LEQSGEESFLIIEVRKLEDANIGVALSLLHLLQEVEKVAYPLFQVVHKTGKRAERRVTFNQPYRWRPV
jgi:hypothetical protein